MLTHLYIRNYALISQLDIDIAQGFSVITGETGAGKSIILGALGLLMGDRADAKAITDGERKCVIEGLFSLNINDEELKKFFDENDIDFQAETIIRRELQDSGKSRAFVNDTPVPLTVLKQLRERIIDIHSQHANLLLQNNDFQLSVVDTMAQNKAERQHYSTLYKQYVELEKQIKELTAQAQQSKEDQDYYTFQLNQLEAFKLQQGEETQLEEEQQRLEHADEIGQSLSGCNTLLSGEENGILSSLKQVLNSLKHISNYLDSNDLLAERTESVLIELRDINDSIESYAESIEVNPQRLQQVNERLDELNTLMQKHHVASSNELIELREQLKTRLSAINSYDEQIAELSKRHAEIKKSLTVAATTLSQTRQQVCLKIKEELERQLAQLAMPNARIDVNITPLNTFGRDGVDCVQFMFAANKNQQLREVTQVASGGEMSRLMLCIKSLIANKENMATIIFDEIDTGVSGEVASKMALIMQQMSRNGRQIIAITHLPQIAAKGEQQYKVFKADTDSRTETNIKHLAQAERVMEIATMLSAGAPTGAAINNAKELLGI